jgi:hypothetical protein
MRRPRCIDNGVVHGVLDQSVPHHAPPGRIEAKACEELGFAAILGVLPIQKVTANLCLLDVRFSSARQVRHSIRSPPLTVMTA